MIIALFSSMAQAQFWTENASGFPIISTGMSKIHIVDANVAWATGYDGIAPANNIQRFTKTVDGGATWTAGAINLGNSNLGISNISGVSATTAYVSAYARGTGQQGGVWITTNGGTTWTRQPTALFNNAASFPNIVHYFNTTDGIVIGDVVNGFWEIYITNNSGTNYVRLPNANLPAVLPGEVGYIAQYAYLGDNIWFATSKGRLYHSANKGANWNVYRTPITDLGGATIYGDFSFTSGSQGILQDNSGNLWRTFDSGATWTLVNISGTGNPYGDAIAYLPGTNQLISTGASTNFSGSSYSLDNGTSWTNIDAIQHIDIAIFDINTAYSGGFTASSTAGGVYKYTGAVLNTQSTDATNTVNIYPNPAIDTVHIESTLDIHTIQVFNLYGSTVLTSDATNIIDIKNLATGMYIMQLNSNQGIYTARFIKK